MNHEDNLQPTSLNDTPLAAVIVVSHEVPQPVIEAVRNTVDQMNRQFHLRQSSSPIEMIVLAHVRHQTEWIGEVPKGYDGRTRALTFSVAAYRHAQQFSNNHALPLKHRMGISLCQENRSLFLAVHEQSRTQLVEYVGESIQRASGVNECSRAVSRFLKELIVNPNFEWKTRLRKVSGTDSMSSHSSVIAPPALVDVWHGKASHAWSVRNQPWRVDCDVPAGGILSGSFYPLHHGHLKLRDAAEKFLRLPVHFELPIINADKPALDYISIDEQRRQFSEHTVAASNAPTFAEKAEFFPGRVFVVGVDTAERIVDARFYGNNPRQMQEALSRVEQLGCRFLVAGRKLEREVQTLCDVAIPARFEKLFVELPLSLFRQDVSSSEYRLRERQFGKPPGNHPDSQ
ncbi:MAG: hypothetical protein Tsb009_17350 [Planctomycetaceae bacterium]